MNRDFFQMSTVIIDRQDLDIYEKMCAAVLSRYAGRSEFDDLITLDIIARRMGTSRENASEAIRKLVGKGLLDSSDANIRTAVFEHFDEGGSQADDGRAPSSSEYAHGDAMSVQRHGEADGAGKGSSGLMSSLVGSAIDGSLRLKGDRQPSEQEGTAGAKSIIEKPEAVEPGEGASAPRREPKDRMPKPPGPSKPKSSDQDELIRELFQMIDEKMNEREARILLNFAGNDLDLIREKYRMVKKSQIADKMELLMMELQKKPGKKETRASDTLKGREKDGSEAVEAAKEASDAEVKPVIGNQLNIGRINKMKAYQDASDMMKKKG